MYPGSGTGSVRASMQPDFFWQWKLRIMLHNVKMTRFKDYSMIIIRSSCAESCTHDTEKIVKTLACVDCVVSLNCLHGCCITHCHAQELPTQPARRDGVAPRTWKPSEKLLKMCTWISRILTAYSNKIRAADRICVKTKRHPKARHEWKQAGRNKKLEW